jgi:hypothetical protein
MFVRFKKLLAKRKGPIFNLSLQESFRDPAQLGRVRSRTICGLGSIKQAPGPAERHQFWTDLDKRLPSLRLSGRLSASDELKVRRAIQEKIPRL